MKMQRMNVMASVVGSLLLAATTNAAITGLSATSVDFSEGYVLHDGSVHAESRDAVVDAWEVFDEDWDVYRLWATFDVLPSTEAGVGFTGSTDAGVDLVLDAGAGGVFFNDPDVDSNTSQNPVSFVDSPTGAFDTFITNWSADGASTPIVLNPSNVFDGFQSSVSCANCGWFSGPTPTEGVVSGGETAFRVLLGQFTVREGSTFLAEGNVIGGGKTVFGRAIGTSSEVPGPTALGVFALAGMLGRRRRCE